MGPSSRSFSSQKKGVICYSKLMEYVLKKGVELLIVSFVQEVERRTSVPWCDSWRAVPGSTAGYGRSSSRFNPTFPPSSCSWGLREFNTYLLLHLLLHLTSCSWGLRKFNTLPTYLLLHLPLHQAGCSWGLCKFNTYLLLHLLLLHQAGCSWLLCKFNTYLLLHLLLHLSCCSWGHSSVKTSLPIPSACWMFLATQ